MNYISTDIHRRWLEYNFIMRHIYRSCAVFSEYKQQTKKTTFEHYSAAVCFLEMWKHLYIFYIQTPNTDVSQLLMNAPSFQITSVLN